MLCCMKVYELCNCQSLLDLCSVGKLLNFSSICHLVKMSDFRQLHLRYTRSFAVVLRSRNLIIISFDDCII